MAMVEENIRRIAAGIAGGLRAAAELDFRIIFPALEKDAGEAGFIADVAAESVSPGTSTATAVSSFAGTTGEGAGCERGYAGAGIARWLYMILRICSRSAAVKVAGSTRRLLPVSMPRLTAGRLPTSSNQRLKYLNSLMS